MQALSLQPMGRRVGLYPLIVALAQAIQGQQRIARSTSVASDRPFAPLRNTTRQRAFRMKLRSGCRWIKRGTEMIVEQMSSAGNIGARLMGVLMDGQECR
jgi:hypothetical protein